MFEGKTVFAQIMSFLPKKALLRCIQKYRGNYKVQRFTCIEQFYCMAFAQLTGRESLRDIVSCLRAMKDRLYHMGIKSRISKSTIADANESRDWRIYADFAQILIHEARALYVNDDLGVDLDETVYALDSTTIDLCLSMFPWAKFRKAKGAVKMHTLLDLRGPIPAFIRITHGKIHDVNILDYILPEPGSYYVMDRAYLDFARLYKIHTGPAYFIVPQKVNTKIRRLYSHHVDRATGLRCDQTVVLTNYYAHKDYPDKLRRIRYIDEETGNDLTFLTNNFILPALTIAQLYKGRWGVELFFKWVKQHLRIKSFFGTSENALKTQIWIAICIYVLIAIIKKKLHMEQTLYTILQVLGLTQFEKIPILELFSDHHLHTDKGESCIQLNLFEL